MTRRTEITSELAGISPILAGHDAVNPYRVPAGYFDALAENILGKIKSEQTISAKEEIENLSPLLAGLSKNMPYDIPARYFQELSSKVSVTNTKSRGARVISLPASKIFRYAVAAVIAGLIAIASWFYLKEPAVSTDEMALQLNGATEMQVLKKINELSDSEIVAFVERVPVWYTTEIPTTTEFNEDDVLLMLAEVSDQELETYIRQHNQSIEKFN